MSAQRERRDRESMVRRGWWNESDESDEGVVMGQTSDGECTGEIVTGEKYEGLGTAIYGVVQHSGRLCLYRNAQQCKPSLSSGCTKLLIGSFILAKIVYP